MKSTMQRWACDAVGRDRLKLGPAPKPSPSGKEVLVKVSAVSLNYRDKLTIDSGMGLPLQFPFVPASDMAGTIEAVREGVARFKPGDRVISNFSPDWIDGKKKDGTARQPPYRSLGGHYPGVLAEYVAFHEDWFCPAPQTLDPAGASTLPCAGLTAWFALVENDGLRAGQTIVVLGTGGVSLFGLQIARAHGADVIVTSSSDEKLARARAMGATYGINRNTHDWVEEVYRLTGDRGADHILETVGGAHFGRSLQAVSVGGRISLVGMFEGIELAGNLAYFGLKAVTVQGIGVGHRRALEDLVRAVDRCGIKPVIDRRYTFTELPSALDHLDRGAFGKIVIEVD